MKDVTYEETKVYLKKVKKVSWLLVIFNYITSTIILFIIAAVLDEVFGDGKYSASDMFYGNIWNGYQVILTILMIVYMIVVIRKNKSIYPKKYIVIGIFGLFGGFILGLQLLSLILVYRDLKKLTPEKVEQYNTQRKRNFEMNAAPQYSLPIQADETQRQLASQPSCIQEDKGYLRVVGMRIVTRQFLRQFMLINGNYKIPANDLKDEIIYQLNPGEYEVGTQVVNEQNKRTISITPGEITTLHVGGTRYNFIFSSMIGLEMFTLFILYNTKFFAENSSVIAMLLCLSVSFFPYAIGRRCQKVKMKPLPIKSIINLDGKIVPNKVIGDELIDHEYSEDNLKMQEIKQSLYQNIDKHNKHRVSEKRKEKVLITLFIILFTLMLLVRNFVFGWITACLLFYILHSILLFFFTRRKSFLLSLASSFIYLGVFMFNANFVYIIHIIAVIFIIALMLYNTFLAYNVDVFRRYYANKSIANYKKQLKIKERSVQFSEKMIRIVRNDSITEMPLKAILFIEESEHYYYIVGKGARHNYLYGSAQIQIMSFIVSKNAHFKNGLTVSEMKCYIEKMEI